MRYLAGLFAVLLVLPASIEARQRPTLVIDYTTSQWDGIIEETVDDFAPYVPLRYKRGTGECPQKKTKRAIVICSVQHDQYSGMANWQTNRIWLVDNAKDWYREHGFRVACHEMMHILADVADNYGAYPDQSCVWGYLDDPGPLDLEMLAENQAKLKKKARKK